MNKIKSIHGMAKARGCAHARLGNFCKLVSEIPTWAEDCEVTKSCEAEEMAALLGGPGGIMHDRSGDSPDSEIPAAYTFFAQFVDHDITLDTRSELHGEALDEKAIEALPNLRTASLDLDCVYGFGPEASPYLYDGEQPGRLRVGNAVNPHDLPRSSDGTALIGDPRNDENIFVSQMHLLFLLFHNRRILGRDFEEAQRDVRYHYQWLVLNDFLKRVVDPEVFSYAMCEMRKGTFPKCDIVDDCGRLCMPVEFSVAAFRFGHTLVRSTYPVNARYPVVELFDERFGTEGFGPVPPELTVDWRVLLDVEACEPYARSKAVDHLLADELIRLPDSVVGRSASENDRSLAFRNLLRGFVLGLPSGQRLALALRDKGYPIDPQADLAFCDIPGWHCVDARWRAKLERHTPLFFYLMREAGVLGGGERLGPVGSAVLMEVFGAMLLLCDSFFSEPDWRPDECLGGEHFTLADLVRYVSVD